MRSTWANISEEAVAYAAAYGDRILKGTKLSELPVQAPVKFELVVNLNARKGYVDVAIATCISPPHGAYPKDTANGATPGESSCKITGIAIRNCLPLKSKAPQRR